MSDKFSIKEQMNVVFNNTDPSFNQEYNSETVLTMRLNTCNLCEFNNNRTCTKCGCPTVMLAQFNFKQCPEGKW